jgi:Zn-dependent protease with chaperone function
MSDLYPPAPANVPKDFTRLPREYRWQVILVLGSLLISLLLYLALVIGSAWLCYWFFSSLSAPQPRRRGDDYIVLKLVGMVGSGLLFLYLLKGLFKGSRQDQTLLVEITEREQPELFEFIRHVCAETKAPLPHKVFVSPEVTAAAFMHTSLLSLVLPTRKNLLIGLGLVNLLNLSEFKAVLAHEFGHFSQRSMRLGSYVYIANKVLADIVYGRDWLDTVMSHLKSIDLRIAIFVWTFLGVLWGLRKVMEAVFKVINIFNLSLMRQMEFNADRVAVSVSGSDAIVHALLRSSFGDQAFRQLANDLWSAADHNLYSRDIFAHQLPAAEMLRRRAKNPTWGQPPAERGPEVQVFKPGEGNNGVPLMWATHPPNEDRERNAKQFYLPAELDEHSPWLLFRDQADLRRRVSQRYYQVFHKLEGPPEGRDPATVQSFLNDEYAETTYPERYQGYYDNRYLEVTDLDKLIAQARTEAAAADQASDELDKLYGADLKLWVDAHQKRLNDFDLLNGLKFGQLTLTAKTLEFRGQAYPPRDIPRLFEQVQQEIEEDQRYKAYMDTRIFLVYGRLAHRHAGAAGQDLFDRYRFHLALQDMHRQVVQGVGNAQAALNYAGNRRELSQDEFAQIRETLRQAAGSLFAAVDASKKLRVPALKNMETGQRLRDFLLPKSLIYDLSPDQNTISPEWIQQFLGQLAEVQSKLSRLLFKSLGGILATQEAIVNNRAKPVDDLAPTVPVLSILESAEPPARAN